MIKRFVKNHENTEEPLVRSAYGTICGVCGIFFNILLFILKIVAGMLAGSLAVTADAFNNLSDAGSSIITLAGFRLAGKKPDPDHPFGHGRMEYIAGFIVSVLIMLMGFELAKASFEKFFDPKMPEFTLLTVGILLASILVKFYMSTYNKKYGKKISSPAMLATAADSLSDTVSTAVVLASGIICRISGFIYLDSICGLLVSAFILLSGYNAAKDTVSPLLGQPPSKEFVEQVESIVLSNPQIIGIHDLVVHNYGPGRVMVSLHAEVSCEESVLVLHDIIDCTENLIAEKLNCEAVIHMDPIDTGNPKLAEIHDMLENIVKKVDAGAMFHDLRMVPGDTHTNLIFDVVIPFESECDEKEAKNMIRACVKEFDPVYECVIKIDKNYTGN